MNSMIEALIHDVHELSTSITIKAALAFIWTWISTRVGHPETAAASLFCLLMSDLLMGSIRAWQENRFRGRRLVSGAFKFFRYWITISIFIVADEAIVRALPAFDVNLTNFLIAYLALNELGSCIEHLAYYGMPMPQAVKERLRKYRETLTGGSE
jgi:phage-related holin